MTGSCPAAWRGPALGGRRERRATADLRGLDGCVRSHRSTVERIGPQRLLCGAIARVVPGAELPAQPGSAARTAHIPASLTPRGRHKGFENLGPEQAKWVGVGAVDGDV